MGRSNQEGPAEDGLNPLDTAADAIGGGVQERQQAELAQAPITINLEAPKRAGVGPKTRSANQDATLEALALSRSAQTPNVNWRSSGAQQRRLDAKRIRNVRGRGSGGQRGGAQR